MNALEGFIAGCVATVAMYLAWVYFSRRRRGVSSGKRTLIYSNIERLKAIGELSVFKVFTKEIVTEVDHAWGDFGKKYLKWILSNKKMAMIFEFEIDFRYDLRSPDFRIDGDDDCYTFHMPDCFHEIHIRDIHFYDEQKSKLIPWLLPDLLNKLFGEGFSEEDKNRIKNEAKKRAEEQARGMIEKVASDVEQSARQTLQSLAKALGARRVEFDFRNTGKDEFRKVVFSNEETTRAAT
ncbi:MAG: DUF4230 domain-containing protein [Spirochaetes bacterium]|nr:DUF4230 domain-containing protein [Spirochaetota bacterium]